MRLILEYVRVRNPLFGPDPPLYPSRMPRGEGARYHPLLSHSRVLVKTTVSPSSR
jgi:hypothetical protein